MGHAPGPREAAVAEVGQIIGAARSRGAGQTVVVGREPAGSVRNRTGFCSALAEDQGRTEA